MSADPATTYIVYDGECPFCSKYVQMVRLRETVGNVELLNMRDPHPVVDILIAKGVNLDDGMALVQGDQISHGKECIHRLAVLSSPSGIFNRVNAWIFRSPWRSATLYPPLRAARNATLRILGRSRFR